MSAALETALRNAVHSWLMEAATGEAYLPHGYDPPLGDGEEVTVDAPKRAWARLLVKTGGAPPRRWC